MSLRGDIKMRKYLHHIGVSAVDRIVQRNLPLTVRKGPFRGMKLLSGSCGSVWTPKLLGSYESELSPLIEEAIIRCPDVFIDLGCAEGYFAIGFALRLPAAKIIAADINPLARRQVRALAERNAVSKRLKLLGWMSPRRLEAELVRASSPVLWCDIEGGEAGLLDPLRVPSLRKAWILVEDHSHLGGVSEREFCARFENSHQSSTLRQTRRVAQDWIPEEVAGLLGQDQRELAVNELRPEGQVWHLFRPRKDPG